MIPWTNHPKMKLIFYFFVTIPGWNISHIRRTTRLTEPEVQGDAYQDRMYKYYCIMHMWMFLRAWKRGKGGRTILINDVAFTNGFLIGTFPEGSPKSMVIQVLAIL